MSSWSNLPVNYWPWYLDLKRGESHGDVRPHNIVIYENSARLIDWQTLCPIADTIWLPTSYASSSTSSLWTEYRNLRIIKARGRGWDLCSLGLSTLFLALGNERKYLAEKDGTGNLDDDDTIARIGYDIFEEMKSWPAERDIPEEIYRSYQSKLIGPSSNLT